MKDRQRLEERSLPARGGIASIPELFMTDYDAIPMDAAAFG